MLRYVKTLLYFSQLRTSFYAAVAAARILRDYSTLQTLDLHSAITDPEGAKDEATCRRVKGEIFLALLDRFGALLREKRVRHGERTFFQVSEPQAWRAYVEDCLEALVLAETCCVLPSDAEIIPWVPDLHGRDEECEPARMHTVFHPPCFARLTSALDLPAPGERLVVPRFHLNPDSSEEPPMSPPDQSSSPAPLTAEEIAELWEDARHLSQVRASTCTRQAQVSLDGREPVRWDLESDPTITLTIQPWTRAIEISTDLGGRELPLATHLIFRDEDGEPLEDRSTIVIPESGETFDLEFFRSGDASSMRIAHRETRLRRRLYRALHRSRGRRDSQRNPDWWPRLAGAAAVSVLLTVSFSLLWWNQRGELHDLRTLPQEFKGKLEDLRSEQEQLEAKTSSFAREAESLRADVERLESDLGQARERLAAEQAAALGLQDRIAQFERLHRAEIVQLSSVLTRSQPTSIVIPPELDEVVFVVDESYREWSVYEEFLLTVSGPEDLERVRYRVEGLRPSPQGFLAATLPSELLVAGLYRVTLSGVSEDTETKLVEYSLRIVVP